MLAAGQPAEKLRRQHGLGCHRMADLVPVPIVWVLESLRMRRIVFEEAGIEVDDFIAERLRFAAKCRSHEIEIGTSSARRSIRLAEAVKGEQDPIRR